MNQSLKALLLIITVLSFSACKKEAATVNIKDVEGFDFGRVRNNTYTNTFFNIRMDIPKGWLVQDEEQKRQLLELGRQVSADDNDETMKAAIKTSEITTANLFTAFGHEPGTVPFSHNLILLAENVSNAPINITPELYLQNANKLLQSSKLDIIQIDNSFTKKTLNGMDFYEMNIVNHMEGLNIHQTYLVTIVKDFALGFIYSYIDDAQKAEIEKTISTLRPYREKATE